MKRILIYLTYDKQNIVDDYIGYFLGSMRSMVDNMIVVCNMPRIERGLHNLTDYAEQIFYRENVGLDCGGFKDALCRFIGWEKLKEYDEVILANDSFYGPFEDIRPIFLEMESRQLDFWGLMKRGNGKYGMTGSDPEHILSFFYAFQAPMIHGKDFQSYWEDMPYYKDYMTVVKQYERQLTRHFSDLGYRYDTYVDTAPNESTNPRNQFFQCDYLSYEMITKRKFPFLKRKQLSYNPLYMQTQENLAQSIAYVDRHTDYDVNFIWENLIRIMNPADLQRSLGLQFILNDREEGCLQALVIVQASWENAVDTVCEYLGRIRTVCEVQIFTACARIVEEYRAHGYHAALSQATDIELLLETDLENYRYLCLIHDCDLSSEQIPSCTGKSYFFNVWENLIKNAGYLNEIVKLLDEKRHVGMIMHPVPIFSFWIGKLEWEWKNRYEKIKQEIEELGLKARIDLDTPPVHVTNNFWVKADIIKSFAKKSEKHCKKEEVSSDAYEYLWTYMVQDCGYLTGIVESTFYASMNEVNYHYYLRTMMRWLSERYGPYEKLQEFKEIFQAEAAAEKYRQKYGSFYVYGTGEMAERCFPWLQDAAAFLVSDGYRKEYFFHGKPILCLSELKDRHPYGVILCLNKENSDNVIALLKQNEISDYCLIY